MNSKDKIFLAIGSVAIIAASGFGGYAFLNNSQTANSSGSSTVMTSTSSASNTSSYQDGTYTATVGYSVPHGNQNSIVVSLTIASGMITGVSSTNTVSDNESAMYIDSFETALKSKVVGQLLNGASFSRIGGASLTTAGFQKALTTIQNEAAA